MAKPSDREYALQRKIKDLEERNKQLEEKLSQLRKKLEKLENPPEVAKKSVLPPKAHECPDCGSVIKTTELPFGKLHICGAACGWRQVKRIE